jgi:antitoxin component of MazEF toxin-antitoxin module
MVARVQKTSESYAIVLTEDALRELNLMEGSAVEIRPVVAEQETARPEVRYASSEEVLAAFERTLPQHEETYRELAK